jgi:hypothetical protein
MSTPATTTSKDASHVDNRIDNSHVDKSVDNSHVDDHVHDSHVDNRVDNGHDDQPVDDSHIEHRVDATSTSHHPFRCHVTTSTAAPRRRRAKILVMEHGRQASRATTLPNATQVSRPPFSKPAPHLTHLPQPSLGTSRATSSPYTNPGEPNPHHNPPYPPSAPPTLACHVTA